METTIKKKVKGSVMESIFDNCKAFSVKHYKALDLADEKDYRGDNTYTYEIVIRHSEGTDAKTLFDAEKEKFAKGGPAKASDTGLTKSSDEPIDIFGSAKTKDKPKSAKLDKQTVTVPGLEAKLLSRQALKAEIDDLSALFAGVQDEIKEIGREKFLELYKANGANHKSFYINDDTGCVRVTPSDKYKLLTPERAAQLIEQYGKDIVTTDTKFYFTPEVLERNMLKIQKLIMDTDVLSVADKQNLLTKQVTYSVAKGAIDNLSKYGKNIEAVMADIQPTFALYDCSTPEKESGGDLLADIPVVSGYSLCHYAPVLDGHTCTCCHQECSVLSEAELMAIIAEQSNEFPEEGSEELEQMHEARHYDNGGEMAYAKGGGLSNSNYLNVIPESLKNRILGNIANHYVISVQEAEKEVLDANAEMLYEYIANDPTLRINVYRGMEQMHEARQHTIFVSKNKQEAEKYLKSKKYREQYREDFDDVFDLRIIEVPYDDFVDYRVIATKKYANGGGVEEISAVEKEIKDFASKHTDPSASDIIRYQGLIDKLERLKEDKKYAKGGGVGWQKANGGELDGSKIGVAKRLKVRDWYIKNYPTDDLGKEINDKINFWSLWALMSQGNDVYSMLEVYDSVVRERVFEKLSKILDIEYDVIYKKWLQSSKYAKGGGVGHFDYIKLFTAFWQKMGYDKSEAEDLAKSQVEESDLTKHNANTFQQIRPSSAGSMIKIIWDVTPNGIVEKEMFVKSTTGNRKEGWEKIDTGDYAKGGGVDALTGYRKDGGGADILVQSGQSILLRSVPSPKEERFLNKEIVVEKIKDNKIIESFVRSTGEKVPFIIDIYKFKIEQYASGGGLVNADNLEVGDEIGYMDERTGRYKYVPIIGVYADSYKLNEIFKKGRGHSDNIYTESKGKLNKYLKTLDNEGFNKPLLKIKKKLSQGGRAAEKEFEISLGNDVYWGNYHWEGNELMMDSCLTNKEAISGWTEYEVEDNDIRNKVYEKLESEKADEKADEAEYLRERKYAAAEQKMGYSTGGGVADYKSDPEYIELEREYKEALQEMKTASKVKQGMLATRLEILQQKKKRIAFGKDWSPNTIVPVKAGVSKRFTSRLFAKGGPMTKEEQYIYWNKEAQKLLKGKKVKAASFMTRAEADALHWDSEWDACLVVELTDGTIFYASQDDEGNDAGFLFLDNAGGTNQNYEHLVRFLPGCIIGEVEYMKPNEIGDWGSAPVAIYLDKTLGNRKMVFNLIPQRDPEGNDGGALFGQTKGKKWVLPVL